MHCCPQLPAYSAQSACPSRSPSSDDCSSNPPTSHFIELGFSLFQSSIRRVRTYSTIHFFIHNSSYLNCFRSAMSSSQANRSALHLCDLPNDVLINVFSKASTGDVLAVKQANKRLHRVVEQYNLGRPSVDEFRYSPISIRDLSLRTRY